MSVAGRDTKVGALRPTVARLLAALADPPGRDVPVAELIQRVWGDHPPARSVTSLHTTVARLRRHLPPGAVQRGAVGYVLDPAATPALPVLPAPRGAEADLPDDGDLTFRPRLRVPWPLVRRDGLVGAALASLTEGRSVVLYGDAGCGKSRVADELLLRLHEEGHPAVALRCRTAAAGLHLGVFAPLLDRSMPSTGLPLVVAARESIVHRLAGRRLVLGLDDIDLLDPLSAVLVSHLVHDGHAVLVGTHRTEAVVLDAVAQLWHEGRCDHLLVPSLDVDATAALGEVILHRPLDAGERADLWARTGGNPLFVTAVLDTEAGADTGSAPTRGADLGGVIGEQLSRLPGALHDALAVVALAEPVGASVLEQLGDVDALVELERRRLVVVEQDGRRTIARVRHPLFAEHVRGTTSRLLARGIRAQLADAVLAAGARRHDDLLRVATWQLDAGQVPGPRLALDAARDALDRHDVELVQRLARRVWDEHHDPEAALLLVQAGYDAAPVTDLVPLAVDALRDATGEVRDRLAWAAADVQLLKAADPAGADALLEAEPARSVVGSRAFVAALAGDVAAAAARVDEGRGDDGLAWWQQVHLADGASHALVQLGRAVEADELVTQLRERRPSGPAGDLVDVYVSAAQARIAAVLGDLAGAERMLLRAVDLARTTLDGPGEGEASAALALVLAAAGRPCRAAEVARAAAMSAHRTHHLAIERWAWSVVAWSAILAADEPAATEVVAALAALPGAPHGGRATALEVDPHLVAAGHALLRGDLSAARACFDAATQEAHEYGRRWDELVVRHERAIAADLLGPADPHAAARATDLAAGNGPLAAAMAAHVAALAAGDPAAVDGCADRFTSLGAHTHALRARRRAVELAAGDGRRELARRLRVRWEEERARCDATIGGAPLDVAEPLTTREREIAELAARGHTSAAIAEQLGLSVRTVDNHLGRAFTKLGVSGRAELAARLLERSAKR